MSACLSSVFLVSNTVLFSAHTHEMTTDDLAGPVVTLLMIYLVTLLMIYLVTLLII